jgi:hypothetical protein
MEGAEPRDRRFIRGGDGGAWDGGGESAGLCRVKGFASRDYGVQGAGSREQGGGGRQKKLTISNC